MTGADQEEERVVLKSIIASVADKLRQTDGMGTDSSLIFERRLDKIIFTPPNQRRSYIAEHSEEMTPGFVEFVQNELKATADQDSKVPTHIPPLTALTQRPASQAHSRRRSLSLFRWF